MKLREALEDATNALTLAARQNARLDAQLLLSHVTCLDRAGMITRVHEDIQPEQLAHYQRLIARRLQAEPIQYLLGAREFYGLRFAVTPDVLIPRPETEHLVEAAFELIPTDRPCRIVDVGTGSGAIAVTLALTRPLAQVTALDISAAALKVARENASAHGVAGRIRFTESDLLGGAGAEEFDIIVSNPPYIADGEREALDEEVRKYEPALALFAGPTGLEVYERLIPQAEKVLAPGGWLLLEIGAGQQRAMEHLLKGWQKVSFVPDLQGIPRVAVAQRA